MVAVCVIWTSVTNDNTCISVIGRATIPSLFLRFVLSLQCYVLENITVLISKKCLYLQLLPLFLIFCSVTVLNTNNT